jgi:hypothetical protein
VSSFTVAIDVFTLANIFSLNLGVVLPGTPSIAIKLADLPWNFGISVGKTLIFIVGVEW